MNHFFIFFNFKGWGLIICLLNNKKTGFSASLLKVGVGEQDIVIMFPDHILRRHLVIVSIFWNDGGEFCQF